MIGQDENDFSTARRTTTRKKTDDDGPEKQYKCKLLIGFRTLFDFNLFFYAIWWTNGLLVDDRRFQCLGV